MTKRLRERQRGELARFDLAIEKAASAGVGDSSLAELRTARDAMKSALAEPSPPTG